MKVKQLMKSPVVCVHPEESVAVAARTLARYNIGILPVCEASGKICGLVTDRDLVIRCMASGLQPERTPVRQVMTGQVTSVRPDMEIGAAAHLMGRLQIRRLPVVEDGKLCGMLSLGDLANNQQSAYDASDALSEITSNLSSR